MINEDMTAVMEKFMADYGENAIKDSKNWREISESVHGEESLRTSSEERESDQEEPWYHSVPIEVLSGGGCTPDGILIKTAGMDAEELKEWDLAQRPKKKKKNN